MRHSDTYEAAHANLLTINSLNCLIVIIIICVCKNAERLLWILNRTRDNMFLTICQAKAIKLALFVGLFTIYTIIDFCVKSYPMQNICSYILFLLYTVNYSSMPDNQYLMRRCYRSEEQMLTICIYTLAGFQILALYMKIFKLGIEASRNIVKEKYAK